MSKIEKIFAQKYILASKSKRRIELLKQLRLNFINIESDADELEVEDMKSRLNPIKIIKYNSEIKSRKVARSYKNEIVIGSDTIVVIGNQVLQKPKDYKEAFSHLKKLSNNKHYVYTGINVINTKTGKEIFGYEKTTVYMRELSNSEIDYYIKNHKPFDKAGAYGIQDDFGCLFVKKIIGDYYTVVGLPLVKFYEILNKII